MNSKSATRQSPKAERVAEVLRLRIALGEYLPGAYLPSERELAEQLGIGRSTAAGALEILVAQGFVERNERRGTLVLAPGEKTEVVSIRLLHPVHVNAKLLWSEASELLRGMEEAVDALPGYEYQRYLYRAKEPGARPKPATPAPSVFLEATHDRLEYVRELRQLSFPAVVANLEWEDPTIDATWTDHARAMREAVGLLVQMGHRRIAYIGYEPGYLFYSQSQRGYVQAMKHTAVSIDESLFCRGDHSLPATLVGYQATTRMLQLNNPPTAIVTARDNFAEGAWHAMRERELVVGRDISLIGYDDLTWSGDEQILTTFQEPAYEMGAKAVEMVVDRIVNGLKPVEQIECPAKLIMRRTVAPLVT